MLAQIFDAISYSKGASVIRMLNSYLGGDVFATGVRAYLKKHAYGNATTLDLWASLSEASGLDVAKIMYPWTREVGYPMVTILSETESGGQITLELKQQRFLSTGDLKKDEAGTWFIPISVSSNGVISNHELTTQKGKITFPAGVWKLNAGVAGFFRVCYSEQQLAKLSKALKNDISCFGTSDRIGILSDAFAFARAGLGPTTGALEILKSYSGEKEQMVLEEISSRFTVLKKTWFKNSKAIQGFDKLQKAIFSPKVNEIGFEYPEGEDHLEVLKRNLVISAALDAKDQA